MEGFLFRLRRARPDIRASPLLPERQIQGSAESMICSVVTASRHWSRCCAAASGAAMGISRRAAYFGRLAPTKWGRPQSSAGVMCSLLPCGTFPFGRLTAPCPRCFCQGPWLLLRRGQPNATDGSPRTRSAARATRTIGKSSGRRSFAGLMTRRVLLEDGLRNEIQGGFPQGDDAFDAVVGLFGMLQVCLGQREPGEPNEPYNPGD